MEKKGSREYHYEGKLHLSLGSAIVPSTLPLILPLSPSAQILGSRSVCGFPSPYFFGVLNSFSPLVMLWFFTSFLSNHSSIIQVLFLCRF